MSRKNGIITHCLVCNEEIYTKLSHHLKGQGKFCSVKCKSIYQTGKKHTTEHINKIRLHSKQGKEVNNWKEDKVGYDGLHDWVERWLGKANHCSFNLDHQSTRYHWANVSGSYLRDLGDWTQLCPKCHKQYDKLLNHPLKNIFNPKNVNERKIEWEA